jgi:hypothetical protein
MNIPNEDIVMINGVPCVELEVHYYANSTCVNLDDGKFIALPFGHYGDAVYLECDRKAVQNFLYTEWNYTLKLTNGKVTIVEPKGKEIGYYLVWYYNNKEPVQRYWNGKEFEYIIDTEIIHDEIERYVMIKPTKDENN